MRKIFIIITISLLLALTVSCQSSGSTNKPKDQNALMYLSAPLQLNSFKIDDTISIAIQNKSNSEIALLPENKVMVLMKKGSDWINIENREINSIPREITLSPAEPITTIFVTPKVPNNNPVTVRIIVTGINQSTNDKIENYVDVTLTP